MILRKFMKHVSEQNWFAVGLDVLVVITGIFLGMQVSEWNEARKDRIEEGVYLNRLHGEVIEGRKIFVTDFAMMADTEKKLEETLAVLSGNDNKTQLGRQHCFAIFASHIYVQRAVAIPTLTEIMANGQLSTLQNDNLKQALVSYLLGRDGLKGLVEHLESVMLVISRKYSHLISLDYRIRDLASYKSFDNKCDFDTMKGDAGFMNDLIDNAAKQYDFVRFSLEQSESLRKIHAILDAELGIEH